MDADLAQLAIAAEQIHELREPVAAAIRLGALINGRGDDMAANVIKDRSAVLDGYYKHRENTPIVRATLDIIKRNTIDSESLDTVSAQIVAIATSAYDAGRADVAAAAALTRVIVSASVVIAVLVSVVIAVLFGRGLSNRLNAVTGALRAVVTEDFASMSLAFNELANCDLRAHFESNREPVDSAGGDEIAELAASYNSLATGINAIGGEFAAMLATLRVTITSIICTSGKLARVSDHVSLGAGESREAVDHVLNAIDGVARARKRNRTSSNGHIARSRPAPQ